jgi:hypothetical protein
VKVKLERTKPPAHHIGREFLENHPHSYRRAILQCLPFYRRHPGARIHRVRSGEIHYRRAGDQYMHTSFKFWCGSLGFLSANRPNASLLALAPEGEADIFCATCEGRAIGAGLDGARVINGRNVIFEPRKK